MRLIQVGNLSDSVDDLILQRMFERHGVVRSAVINRHCETGHSTGVGFIEMESDEEGAAAISALHHREHCGRMLSVCWSEAPKDVAADRSHMYGPMTMISDKEIE